LPSSGTTDVIATMRTPPARENRSAVRNARYASAIAERGATCGRRSTVGPVGPPEGPEGDFSLLKPYVLVPPTSGIAPRFGSCRYVSTWSVVRMLRSRYDSRNANARPPPRPRTSATARFFVADGRKGLPGGRA